MTTNALTFTQIGGKVKIIAIYNKQGSMLKVLVEDNGVGISKKDQVKLLEFKKFSKLEKTANLNPHGIGLGLALCHSFVAASNGTIGIESKGQGKGSTFTFSMEMTVDESK